MEFESLLASKISNNLDSYFPEKGLEIKEIKKVKENIEGGKIGSVTYRFHLESKDVNKFIYVKHFGDWINKHKKDIIATCKLNKMYGDELNMPKIYDFFEDINTIVMGGVKGMRLSLFLTMASLPIVRNFYEKRMCSIIKGIAQSTALLQKLTIKKYTKALIKLKKGEYDVVKKSIDSPQKLWRIRSELSKMKVPVVRNYTDFKLGNVLVSENDFKVIDFLPLWYDFYFVNPITFSLSLELTQRFPHFNEELFQKLKNVFYRKYKKSVPWEIDTSFLNKVELIYKYKLLAYFKKKLAEINIPYKFSVQRDIRYLTDRINRGLSELS